MSDPSAPDPADIELAGFVDMCPTCGSHSVQACRDDEGRLLALDHPDRPTRIPDMLGMIPPYPDD